MSRLIEAGKILDNLSGMLKNMDDYDAGNVSNLRGARNRKRIKV